MADNLALFSNKILRSAIRRNRVSFPAQAPVFQGEEMQARMAHLYFICGWKIRDLATRYSINCENTRKTLNDWRVRAISSGYIQEIELDGDDHAIVEAPTGWAAPGSNEIESFERDEHPRTFSIVTRTKSPVSLRAATPSHCVTLSDDTWRMLLDEIETGSRGSTLWPAFCLRLLSILKQECLRLNFRIAAAQVDRIEATQERDPELARELLRDLRTRISDEESVSVPVVPPEEHTPVLMRTFVSEIELSIQEADGEICSASTPWPAYCSRLLAAVRDGCTALGLRLTATQIGRVEDAALGGSRQLKALLRDLGNRMSDELGCSKSVNLPVISQRYLAAGAGR